MKKTIKALLKKIGLLKAGRVAYSFIKGLSPAAAIEEIKKRSSHNPIPIPPSRLIFLVIGYRWVKTFLESGQTIVHAMTDQLKANGIAIRSFTTILDFGCGCGRLLRHLPAITDAKLSGCDYNAELIEWSEKNLTFAKFKRNTLAPPLPYPADAFDFIFVRSIFTHLNESLQKEWVAELHRVLRPGGYLYFTTHGEQFMNQLLQEEKQNLLLGKLIVREAKEEGHNVCSSFELEPYVRKNLTDGFILVDYLPGKAAADLRQDAYILRRM